jgi:subtilase family serine protease
VALLSASLFAVGAPAVAATVSIEPGALSLLASTTQPPTQAECVAFFTVPCYVPAQLQTAYNEQPLLNEGITGAGQTIVIVDSFGSPTIQSDLSTFDAQFGIPDPPSFKIIQPAGAVTFDPTNGADLGWAGETTLDVEYAHTMAPGANILLVETPVAETEGTAGFPQIVEAENYVVHHHLGDVISQSFGASEASFPNAQSVGDLRSAYINAFRHGVTVLAASGDNGSTGYLDTAGTILDTSPTVGWPASDPLVTGVGGTQLQLDANGNRTAPDQVWNDTYNTSLQNVFFGNNGPNPLATGGGESAVFGRPLYQIGVANVVGDHRP